MEGARSGAVLISFLLVAALAAQPPAELANLRVVSQPGVSVIWEGVLLGEVGEGGTLLIERIPPGEYTIVLRKQDFVDQTLAVTAAGGRTTELEVLLRREPSATVGGPPSPPTAIASGESEASVSVPVGSEATKAEPGETSADRKEPAREQREREEPGPPVEVERRSTQAPTESTPPALAGPGETADGGGRRGAGDDVASMPPASHGGSAEVGDGLSFGLLLVLAAGGLALAGMAWLMARGRRPAEPQAAASRPASPVLEVKKVSRSAAEPAFIDDLRRREKDMSTGRGRRRRTPEDDVIDVEFSEVGEVSEGD